MCRITNCKRHEYEVGLCLTHLREATQAGLTVLEAASWRPRDTRKKAVIDSAEVLTNDAPVSLEERNTDETE